MPKLVVISTLFLATLAFADPATDAKAHYERGATLFAEKQYADALAEFTLGFDTSHRPLFLFNMGESARLAGQPDNARTYYERYIAAEPSGKFSSIARERLAALPAPTRTEPPTSPRVEAAPSIPTPAAAAAVAFSRAPLPSTREPSSSPSMWRRWPVWTGIAAAVVGGSVALYLTMRRTDSCNDCVTVNLRD